MFTPASEFDYREVIQAQLEALVAPLLDSRRGIQMDNETMKFEGSFEGDCGLLTVCLTLKAEP